MAENDQTLENQNNTTPNNETPAAEPVLSNAEKIEELSNRVLATASSVFPFQLFPSTITVEETRVTVIHRQLWSSQVQTVDIKQLTNVALFNGLLFAQLTINSEVFTNGKTEVHTLNKQEATHIHGIIEGLKLFETKGIKTTELSVNELIAKLKELSAVENIG